MVWTPLLICCCWKTVNGRLRRQGPQTLHSIWRVDQFITLPRSQAESLSTRHSLRLLPRSPTSSKRTVSLPSQGGALTGNSMGVTLSDIRSYLLKQFPALRKRGISRTAIHQLMVVPCKGMRNALRYTGLVEAKVPAKDNSQHKAHLGGHFAFTQAN